jgi:hypothetical protein
VGFKAYPYTVSLTEQFIYFHAKKNQLFLIANVPLRPPNPTPCSYAFDVGDSIEKNIKY